MDLGPPGPQHGAGGGRIQEARAAWKGRRGGSSRPLSAPTPPQSSQNLANASERAAFIFLSGSGVVLAGDCLSGVVPIHPPL